MHARLALLVVAVSISGCLTGDMDAGGPERFTEPTLAQTLEITGTLQGAAPSSNSSMRFSFDARTVDCQVAPQSMTVEAETEDFFTFQSEMPILDSVQLWERRAGKLFLVTTLAGLQDGQRHLLTVEEHDQDGGVHNTALLVDVHSVSDQGDGNHTLTVSLPEYPQEGTVDLLLGESSDRRRFVEARRPWTMEDLHPDIDVLAQFVEDPDHGWSLTGLSMGDGYVKDHLAQCSVYHAHDLHVSPYQGTAQFLQGAPTSVALHIENVDDNDLPYRPGDASLVDLTVLRPGTPTCPEGQSNAWEPGPEGGSAQKVECLQSTPEDRLDGSRVGGCAVQPPAASTLPSMAQRQITYVVTCDHDIPSQEAEHLAMVGAITFTDEFGTDHDAPSGALPFLATFVDVQIAAEDRP